MDFDEELGVLVGGIGFEFVDFAGGFVGDAGVERGDAVAVCLPRLAVFVGEPGFGFDASAEVGGEGVDEGFVGGVAVGNDEGVGADRGLRACDGFEEFDAGGHEFFIVEEIAEDDITHAEATGGGWGAAEEFDEVVVSSATSDGSLAVGECFEDGAGVVSEAAGDGEVFGNPRIDFDHRAHGAHRVQARGVKVGLGMLGGEEGDERCGKIGVGSEGLEGIGGEFGFAIEEGESDFELVIGDAERCEVVRHYFAVAELKTE